jgi:uncharacterized protein (TIGR01777 family)
MKVLITGSRGLLGSYIVPFLESKGHQVTRLVRSNPQANDVLWNPEARQVDKAKLEGFDAVIHLAGDNIASGRWTASKKDAIRKSRVEGTRFLSETLASLSKPPKVLVAASAIGYYGDRCDEILTEASTPGTNFLAQVCKEWEASTAPVERSGTRVVNLRIGVVLSTKGGALNKMLPPFKMGAGGIIGSGKQYISWITPEDISGITEFILTHNDLRGPVNAVAPNAVTNHQFTAALGAALKRPTIFPVPGFAAHLLLGEMADELLLSSALVKPEKLLSAGYKFKHEDIKSALVKVLAAA